MVNFDEVISKLLLYILIKQNIDKIIKLVKSDDKQLNIQCWS